LLLFFPFGLFVATGVFWPLALVLMAVLGILAIVRGGDLRLLMAGLNVLDLVCLLLSYIALANSWNSLPFLKPSAPYSDPGLLFRIGIVMTGLFLTFWLANGWPLWKWLTFLLPVRGLQARRLVTGVALFGVLAPWLELTAGTMLIGGKSSPTLTLQTLATTIGIILYLLPIGEVLARSEKAIAQ
jgi:hypothetical protein